MKPDQTVTVRQINVGPAQGDLISVDSGLAPGESVVIDGTDKLREGAKVEAVPRPAAERKSG
jgi:multidrug efflux system membrane fusion protein